MNDDIRSWNYGLLFASLCTILGIIGIVSVRRTQDRWLSSGLLMQGVLLIFVVGSSYYHSAVKLQLGGLVIVGFLLLQRFIKPDRDTTDAPSVEDEPE